MLIKTGTWSTIEIEQLKEFYRKTKDLNQVEVNLNKLAEQLNRTKYAVMNKAQSLGLQVPASTRKSAKFIGRYHIDETTGCWIWRLSLSSRGYGNDGARLAHVVMYEQVKGKVPDGLELDHTCRNKACINPDHLEAVTHAENTRRGNGSILTMEIAREIRRINPTNERAKLKLAKKYGVAIATIANIVKGRTWKE